MQRFPQVAIKLLTIALWIAGLSYWDIRGARAPLEELLLPQQEELPVFTVCPQGPPLCQFKRIQEAINAAPDPDSPYYEPTAEIRVAPGIYEENLLLLGKVVLLKGAGKDLVLLRTPQKYTPVILIVGVVGRAIALIEGFTINGLIALAGVVAAAHIRSNRLEMIIVSGSLASVPFEENEFLKGDFGHCGIWGVGVGQLKISNNTFQASCRIEIEQALLNIPGREPWRAPGERIQIEGNKGEKLQIWIKDSSAIAIQKNTASRVNLNRVENALIAENIIRGDGISVSGSSNVTIQKNLIEKNEYGIVIEGLTTAVVGNRIVQNKFGLVTKHLGYVTLCRDNEIKENEVDYGVGWPSPRPSPELKKKCEGS